MQISNTRTQTSLAGANVVTQAFTWMFVGLLTTGLTALYVASHPAIIERVTTNPFIFYGFIIAEFALVFTLSARINRMSFEAALAAFMVYSFLNGITLSFVFLVYTSTSIAQAFIGTAALFGAMAVYGYTTKRDLTSLGNLAFMALLGIILTSVVNLFFRSSAVSYVISYIAVFVFTALTAYDTQKIKMVANSTDSPNVGIYGALQLYLDFINLFLNLLRIFGRQRD